MTWHLCVFRFYCQKQLFTEEDEKIAEQEGVLELEPMKLPGRGNEWTHNVMYPNDQSAVWDVDRKLIFLNDYFNVICDAVWCMQRDAPGVELASRPPCGCLVCM